MTLPNASSPRAFDLEARHADNLAEFTDSLARSRFWHILPDGENDIRKASGLFDTQTRLLYPPAANLRVFLDQHPFVFVHHLKDNKRLATLHTKTRLLWNNETSNNVFSLADGKQLVSKGRWAGLEGWRLPTKAQLQAFATASNNPHQKGSAYRLTIAAGSETYHWLTVEGHCDVDDGCWGISSGDAYIFACNLFWKHASDAQMLADMMTRAWRLLSPQGQGFAPQSDSRWQGLSIEALLMTMLNERIDLGAVNDTGDDKNTRLDPHRFVATDQLEYLDYTPCRLPKLDRAQLTDPEKGVWELWGTEPATLARFGLVARDPGRDVQHRAVAIDFGTSSTVVAMDTASGARELLRIGVRDFYADVKARHFENPTVLECIDFTAFEAAWTAHAYRPALDWDWVRAAHEAQESYRDNPGKTEVLARILPRLKQWALRSSEDRRVRITDGKGRAIELAPHSERNPVRGQPLEAGAQNPFDPIELYAWYLGMAINWRGRGLFLKYYLSFPAKYPREIKDRTLASFRRGLQRSLPHTLIEYHPQVLNDFAVSELASEPAAYAAAALPQFGVEPTEAGVPYAVFDFGGGTTDFDFGLLRWATPAEEQQGYERVFEHLASGGDNFLGGENLLEHLVYIAFQHNLAVLREKRIQFTKPLDANPFTGSEAFLAPTQAAQTNTVVFAATLRPFLEDEAPKPLTQIKLDLIDADGTSIKQCELKIDAQALNALLESRIRGGVEAFLAELARLRAELPDSAPIHLLLAGNGSRSRYIKGLFDIAGEHWTKLLDQAFGDEPPEIIVHPPLPMDEKNPHSPTAKTGVALGLLRLVPGENTLLIDHLRTRHDGQAPFAWFVGRLRRGRFEPVLSPSTTYGQWQELGHLQQGVFSLFATASPRAHQGLTEGDPELKKLRQDFPAAPVGSRLFARAVSPHALELAAALERTALDSSSIHLTPINLTHT